MVPFWFEMKTSGKFQKLWSPVPIQCQTIFLICSWLFSNKALRYDVLWELLWIKYIIVKQVVNTHFLFFFWKYLRDQTNRYTYTIDLDRSYLFWSRINALLRWLFLYCLFAVQLALRVYFNLDIIIMLVF